MLELNEVSFSYPNQTAPYVFNLKADSGAIITITGPSGAGKSTLLNLISGFLTPDTGTIKLDKIDIIPLLPQQRPVSILFQDDNLFDHLSVEKNLELGMDTSIPKVEKRNALQAALADVDLLEFQTRSCQNLSGGQKQRVALARTLLRNKPILLLDEPFANLDRDTADNMRQLVKDLSQRNSWHTLIVSHLPEDAAEFADRTYSLSDSRLRAD